MSHEQIHTLPAGKKVSEYEIHQVLGEGGFGITYLATDLNLDIQVAIKEYFPGGLASRDATHTVRPYSGSRLENYQMGLKTFIREARLLAQLSHQNIVTVRRYFEDNGTAYIVMDFIQGMTLHDKLEQIGKMTEDEVKAVFLPILDGLNKAHKMGILHRDIKPENILISDEGQPILIDFGAAKQQTGEQTRAVSTIQTVTDGFSPIEQYSSSKKVGTWSDIYAISVSMYYCLTMEKVDSATDRVIDDSVVPLTEMFKNSHEFNSSTLSVIDAGMHVAFAKRPQTIDDFLEQLNIESSQKNDERNSETLTDVERSDISDDIQEQPEEYDLKLKNEFNQQGDSQSNNSPEKLSVDEGKKENRKTSKKSTVPWIAIVIVAFLLLGGGGYWAYDYQKTLAAQNQLELVKNQALLESSKLDKARRKLVVDISGASAGSPMLSELKAWEKETTSFLFESERYRKLLQLQKKAEQQENADDLELATASYRQLVPEFEFFNTQFLAGKEYGKLEVDYQDKNLRLKTDAVYFENQMNKVKDNGFRKRYKTAYLKFGQDEIETPNGLYREALASLKEGDIQNKQKIVTWHGKTVDKALEKIGRLTEDVEAQLNQEKLDAANAERDRQARLEADRQRVAREEQERIERETYEGSSGKADETSGSHSNANAVPIVRIEPKYPMRAARDGVEGWVRVTFSVNSLGSTYGVRVMSSSPPGVFDRAAVSAVSKWKYKPKVENGKAVDQHNITTQVNFKLSY